MFPFNKKSVDPCAVQLIDYSKSNSLMKPFTDVTMISKTTFMGKYLIYMLPKEESLGDSFMLVSYDCSEITDYLFNVPDIRSYNKFLKKTMSACKLNKDNSLTVFSPNKKCKVVDPDDCVDISELDTSPPDISTIKLTLQKVTDESAFTSKYRKMFKDVELTKKVFNILMTSNNWRLIPISDIDALINNELISIWIDDYPIYFTKAIFGQVRRTKSIRYHVIKDEERPDSVLILFEQVETGGTLYHLLRFLIVKED